MTFLAIYRAWARGERQRLTEPPRGHARASAGGPGPQSFSRRDIESMIEELFDSNGNFEVCTEERLYPLLETLSRESDIEGQVCRGEDRVEVSSKSSGLVVESRIQILRRRLLLADRGYEYNLRIG